MTKDRWNLAKFRILETLQQRGVCNSIELSESTRKELYETTNVLNRLVRQRHVRAVVNNHNNNGCILSYKLTPGGRRYLSSLEQRFRRGEDLNFKYIGEKINYPVEVLSWAQRTIPPPGHSLQYTGQHHDLKLTRKKQEAVITDNVRELHLFEDGAGYQTGDTFDIIPFHFYIYYVEQFTLTDYAIIFSKYHKPKAPGAYYTKLQDIHPGTNKVCIIYFRRIDHKPAPSPNIPVYTESNTTTIIKHQPPTSLQPSTSTHTHAPGISTEEPVFCAVLRMRAPCPNKNCKHYRECHPRSTSKPQSCVTLPSDTIIPDQAKGQIAELLKNVV